MAEALPVFPKFDPSSDTGDVVVRWKKWVSRFRNLMVAINVTNADRQKALLLHYVGDDTLDIFDTLTLPIAQDAETTVDVAIRCLTSHFAPKQNTEFEVYKFRQAKQSSGEDIMAFLTGLRHMAGLCEFVDANREIKSQLIAGCQSAKLRRRALSDTTMTLDRLIEYARTAELAEGQAANMEQEMQKR